MKAETLKLFPPTHPNVVDAYVPEYWANETLSILFDELVMANLVHRDFENQIAANGDVVNTRRPNKFIALRKGNDDDVTVQDANATNVQVPLNQHWHVSFTIKDREESLSFKDLVTEFLEPAIKAVAEEVDKMLLGQLVRYHTQTGGQLGQDITNLDAILELRRKQNELNVPSTNRWLVINPIIDEQLLKLDTFHEADKLGDGGVALREALIGRKLGYNFLLSNLISSVAGGSFISIKAGAIDNVGGYLKGEAGGLTVDGFAAGALLVGTWLTIDGSKRPYRISATVGDPATEITLDRPLEDLVLDDAVIETVIPGAVNNGAGYPLNWEKAIAVDGFAAAAPQVGQFVTFGNVIVGTALHTILQVTNTGAGEYDITLDRPLELAMIDDVQVNLGPAGNFGFAFVRNAIALVSRPLALTGAGLGPRTAVAFMDGIGVRVTISYEGRAQGVLVTVDLLCGVAELYSELGAVLLA